MARSLRLPNGATDWTAYLERTNAIPSFQERINSNIVIKDSVVSHADADLTSGMLATKHNAKIARILFRRFPSIINGDVVEEAAYVLSYDCIRKEFVLTFFPEMPQTLEQLEKQWHSVEEVFKMNIDTFIRVLYGCRGFTDGCPLRDADYGFQLCVLIETGVFITDFLHVFDQWQYGNVNEAELWQIRPMLKKWREKLLDLAHFPKQVVNEVGECYVAKYSYSPTFHTASASGDSPIMPEGSEPNASSLQTPAAPGLVNYVVSEHSDEILSLIYLA